MAWLAGVQKISGRTYKRENIKQYANLDDIFISTGYWDSHVKDNPAYKNIHKVKNWRREIWWNDAYLKDRPRKTVWIKEFVANDSQYRIMVTDTNEVE